MRKHASAQCISFNGQRTVGMEVAQKGEAVLYEATTEVTLAASAISTPHLLLLSGVGDPKHPNLYAAVLMIAGRLAA